MQLNYKKFGSGKPLLVLHGLMGMLDNWLSYAKLWEPHFEVYLIDQRNHGHSPHDSEHNYEVMVEDLAEFIREHHLVDFHLLGHSMGGKTVMKYAQNYPELIDKLVVADIAPVAYPVRHQTILDALNAVDFNVVQSRGDVGKVLMPYIQNQSVVQFLMKNLYWKEPKQLAFRFNLEAITQNIEIIGDQTLDQVYTGETLFLRGENSDYVLPEHYDLIETAFPNSSIETVSNAGHWLHAENPTEFNNKLMAFLV